MGSSNSLKHLGIQLNIEDPIWIKCLKELSNENTVQLNDQNVIKIVWNIQNTGDILKPLESVVHKDEMFFSLKQFSDFLVAASSSIEKTIKIWNITKREQHFQTLEMNDHIVLDLKYLENEKTLLIRMEKGEQILNENTWLALRNISGCFASFAFLRSLTILDDNISGDLLRNLIIGTDNKVGLRSNPDQSFSALLSRDERDVGDIGIWSDWESKKFLRTINISSINDNFCSVDSMAQWNEKIFD